MPSQSADAVKSADPSPASTIRPAPNALRRAARALWRGDVLICLACLGLYVFSLAPDILPADAGEFQTVVPLLGVAHPPGFVPYVLLGKLFGLLVPWGHPAYRLNLFSAVTGAATVAVVYRAVAAGRRSSVIRSWSVVVAAALGVSTTFWSQSTTANVRSLTGLFTALAVWVLVVERPGTGDRRPTASRDEGRTATVIGPRSPVHRPSSIVLRLPTSALLPLILSLGILHHASFAFVAAVLGAYWLWLQRADLRRPGWWLRTLAVAAAPWLMLLYLPMRGAQGAFLAPPRLATLSGFLEHVLARGFGGDLFYFADPAALPDRLRVLWTILQFQFNWPILVLAALGLIVALRRDWRWGLTLAAAFGLHTFVAITYRAPQTVEYLLPAYVLMAVMVGENWWLVAGGWSLVAGRSSVVRRRSSVVVCPSSFVARSGRSSVVLRLSSVVLLSLATSILFARNLPSYRALARDRSAREYAEAVLRAAPPGAAVLAAWHWATPLWYLQRIEGLRPDVEVIYVFPEGESLAQTWVRRVEAEIGRRPVVVTGFYPREFAATGWRFVPLGPAWQVEDGPLIELPARLAGASVAFGPEGWRLAGHAEVGEGVEVEAGASFPVTVAWQAPSQVADVSFFVQLIGPDGGLYGQADWPHAAAGIAPGEFVVDRAEIAVRPDALPGDYRLVAGAYRADGSRLVAGDADQWPLATVRVGARSTPAPTAHRALRPVGRAWLTGYDYDRSLPDSVRLYLHWRLGDAAQPVAAWSGGAPHSILQLPPGPGYVTTAIDLPPDASALRLVPDEGARRPGWLDAALPDPAPGERYVPLGDAVVLTGARVTRAGAGYVVDLEWLSARPLTQDLIAKVDLVGEGYAWRAESDSVPVGGAVPTLKWLAGSRLSDRHRLAVPPEATPGAARFEMAMYDHFTGRVLPIGDPRLAMLAPTVPLGEVTIP